MQFPEQRERLGADWRLEATTVEELLRFHSPIEEGTEPQGTGERCRSRGEERRGGVAYRGFQASHAT